MFAPIVKHQIQPSIHPKEATKKLISLMRDLPGIRKWTKLLGMACFSHATDYLTAGMPRQQLTYLLPYLRSIVITRSRRWMKSIRSTRRCSYTSWVVIVSIWISDMVAAWKWVRTSMKCAGVSCFSSISRSWLTSWRNRSLSAGVENPVKVALRSCLPQAQPKRWRLCQSLEWDHPLQATLPL